MLKQPAFPRRQAGLTLVELMIAIVAGLIVIGAALAFTVSTVRAYSENIRSTRLSQELRTGMNLVVRELRRAGYDSAAVTRVMTDETPSGYTNVTTGAGCIVYTYDHQPAGSNARGFKLNNGELQMKAAASAACSGDNTGWTSITDSRVVNITTFTPTLNTTHFCSVLAKRDTNGDKVDDQFDIAEGSVRSVSLTLAGSLASDSSVARQLTDSARVRSDELDYCTVDAAAGAKCNSAVTTNLCPAP